MVFLLYINRNISEEKITLDIEKQIIRTLKKTHEINSQHTDVKTELCEDVLNKRFVLYSFNNPLVGYRHTGYAIYEIRHNNRFKRDGFGWNSSAFNVKHLSINQKTEVKTYLMVYGMNKANEKQIYEYTCGTEKKIIEFSGDYFLKKYPLDSVPISFRNINLE